MRIPFLLILACSSASAAQQLAGPTEHDARIARIERRLYPGVSLANASDSGWSVPDRLRAQRVAGMSVAVISNGKIAWARAYGKRDLQNGTAVTTNTLFQAGSISKPVAATVALQLVGQGTLRLDTDVNTQLRRWQVPASRFTTERPVTLRGLLTHSAGITVHGFPGYRRGTRIPTALQTLRGVAPANSPAIRVDTFPGAINRYSGGGYQIAQALIEDVTRTTLDRLADSLIFQPLGMTRSTYRTVAARDFGGDIARGYYEDLRPVPGGSLVLPEMAAASLWSTPTDLARFVVALQSAAKRGGLIPTSIATEMMTVQPPGANQGIGVGLKTRGDTVFRFSHTGANDGFQAVMIGYLDRAEGIVVMTNGDNGSELAMEYIRAVAHEYGWEDMAPEIRDTISISAAARRALVGRYQLAPNWIIEVRERDGKLVAGPAGRALLPLFAESEDRFFFTAVAGAKLDVASRDGGRVSAITWHQDTRRLRGERIPD